MERLNDIYKKDAQHIQRRRPESSERLTQPPAPQHMHPAGSPPSSRRPLREQTARMGDVARAYQPERHHGSHEQAGYPHPPKTRYAGRQVQGDAHQPGTAADVEDEWQEGWDEEETGSIRYGDWESDIYDPPAPEQEPEERPPLSWGASRIAQSHPQGSRSLVTQELRRPVDEVDATPSAQNSPSPPQPAPYYLSSTPPPPFQAAAPSIAQAQRVTQPLNRSSTMARGRTPAQQDQNRQHQRESQGTQQRRPEHLRQQGQAPSPPNNREQAQQLIPAPYTSPKATCPICKGKGYLRADVPFGHPNFGKPIACECKERERAERRRLQLHELSNLNELKKKTFENFIPDVSPAVHEAFDEARRYAEDPDGWLLLIGKVGSGKTHLAAAIANRSLARGSLVLFSTAADLLDHLRIAFLPSATEVYDQVFIKMREAELLVIDDLGAEKSSPWANEKLFQLLNYRYNYNMPTVITSNVSGLQGIDERIRSRLTDSSLVTRVTIDRAIDFRPRNYRSE